MMAYTIKEIAGLAVVTTRTIRYYDEIGLLSPAEVGEMDTATMIKATCCGCSKSYSSES